MNKRALASIILGVVSLFSCLAPEKAGESDEVSATLASGLVKTRVTAGLGNASALAIAPDGRIFVTLRGTNGNGSGGTATASVRVVKAGALLATPFVNITV